MNKSPWLEQLDQNRIVNRLEQDIQTDLVVVGGGIAGMTTAYYLLKKTTKKVVLIEAGKIAHGATGHNAGQVVAYFEKPFHEIVKEYGQSLAIKAQDGIEEAWGLLEDIIKDAKLTAPLYKFSGYTGYTTETEIMAVLEQDFLNAEVGLNKEQMLIDESADFVKKIPDKYKNFYILVKKEKILELIDTSNSHYQAVGVMLKGCINSALLVEELAGYLLKTYSERFQLFEHSPVNKVVLDKKGGVLTIKNYLVFAGKVILCTNGFENLNVINLNGADIDNYFHSEVKGVVAYMAGFKEDSDKPPGAFAYFEGQKMTAEIPYFYLTRRPYSTKSDDKYNLVTIGGPEMYLPDNIKYDGEDLYPETARKLIDEFIKKDLKRDMRNEIDYKFFWHGLMGYTKTGLRMIGPDPNNTNILYNLGCNGVGILPSIYGAKRIAQFILKKKLEASVFDPHRSLPSKD